MSTPYDLAIQLFGTCPKDSACYSTDTCSTVFLATLFIIARKWKLTKCPASNGWIMKTQHMFRVEFYLGINQNEIVKIAVKQMKLENIIMHKVTQKQTEITYIHSNL